MFDCLHRNPEGPCPLFCINRGTQGGRIDPLKIKFKTLIIQSKEPPLLLCHFLAQFFTTSTTFSVPQTIHFTCFKKHQEVKRDGADLHLQIPFLLFLAEEVPNPGEEMPRWEFAASPEPEQPWQTEELKPGLRHRRKPAKRGRNFHRAKFHVYSHFPGIGQTKLVVLDAPCVWLSLLACIAPHEQLNDRKIN